MSQDNNNIIVKSTLPRTASAEDKLNDIINQLQEKYQGRTIYTLWEIKKENREVNFDTVAKWLKEVNGSTLSDYLVSKGILTPAQYFDIVEKDLSVEDLKGKKCCAFSGNGSICTSMQDDMAKCGAIIVPPNSNEIDYVCGAMLKKVSKIPPDNRNDVYSLFDRRDKGELNFEVVAYGFQYKVEAYIKSLILTQEERTDLGISTYNQPQEIIYDYGYTIINNIKLEDIPQYDATKHYWSLNYFYGWYEASGGEIRGTALDPYCVEDSEDPANIIKRNFAIFASLCNRIEDKQIQSYISRKAHTLRSESKKSMILASLGYISDFDGCWCIVLSAGKGDAFTIKLQKVKMLSLWDDCDYDLEKLEENGIPATLCAIIEDHANDYAFRGMPGYIWIDNTSGVIPQGAFANDPGIKYVEMSDNINKIDFNAFANCDNLESVRIGRAVEIISAGAFANCGNLKKVIIPESVKTIDPRCFKDCSNLSEVIFEGDSRCEAIDTSAFSGCTSLKSINIPRCIKTIYDDYTLSTIPRETIPKKLVEAIIGNDGNNIFYHGAEKQVHVENKKEQEAEAQSYEKVNTPEKKLTECKKVHDELREKLVSAFVGADYLYPQSSGFRIEGVCIEDPNIDVFKELCEYASSDGESRYDGEWSALELYSFLHDKTIKYVMGSRYSFSLNFGGLPPLLVLLSYLSAYSEIRSLEVTFTRDKWEARGDYSKKSRVGIKYLYGNFVVDNFSDNDKYYDCERWDYIPGNYTVTDFFGDYKSLVAYEPRLQKVDALVLPDAIWELQRDVFKGCKFKHVFFGIHRYNIESGVFSECKYIERIDWPNTLYICENMFKNCINLTTVNIPDGVFGIEKGAFAGCKNLVKINIPSTVAFIEEGAFEGCDMLVSKNPEVWSQICSTSTSKAKFLDDIESYKQYIINNGYSTFKDIYYGFQYIIDTMKACKLWHKLYDPYIDNLDKLNAGNYKYVFYATKKQLESVEINYNDKIAKLGWKKTKYVSDTTDYLIVDTADIPRFTTFMAKQKSLAKGDGTQRFCAETPVEKAIELIEAGSRIKIITLKNFCELLNTGAVGNEVFISRSDSRNSSDIKITKEDEKGAAKLTNQERKANIAEILIAQIIQECSEKSCFLSIEEICEKVDSTDLSRAYFSKYIGEKHGKTIHEFFEDANVIRSLRHDFNDTLEVLKKRYKTRPRVCKVSQLIFDNADLDLSIIGNNAKKFTNMTAKELLLSEGILAIEETPKDDIFIGVLYMPGNEPENVKRRLATLFSKLDESYPDKVIEGLNREHKNWGETVTELYRLLGYANSKNFLMAYGYTVADNKGGRPKADHASTIEELKRRYPKGANFKNVDELMAANPDIAKKLNTLQKDAQQVLGISFGKWLKSVGLMGGKAWSAESESNTSEVTTLQTAHDQMYDAAAAELRRIREDNERRVREDQERQAKEETERKAREAREEAERKAREESEQKAREEAARKAREETERMAREAAARKTKEEAERRAREEAEQKAREEEECRAREDAERKAREEEAFRRAQAVATGNAIEEAYRKALEDAERRKREVAERNALEAERKAREEAERKKREEIERICREAEERRLRAEAERQAQEEAERLARESERKAREEAERKAREEEERKAKEEAERKEREKERRKAAREEAKRKAREEEERKAREEAERKAREEAERLEQEHIRAERRSKNLCQHCGGTFKGLFTKKCSNCGMKKDY